MYEHIVPMMNRRNFMQAGSMTVAAGVLEVTNAFASFEGLVAGMKRDARSASVTVSPLRGGLTVIENVGGNITVLKGTEGLLLVDSGIAEQHPKILAALHEMGGIPVREVINTHWHFDHTGGNPWLHVEGARLTAHKNTFHHLLAAKTVTPWHYTFEPIAASGRPTYLLTGNGSLQIDGRNIAIHHTPKAHTDGDLMAQFEDANVLSTGDVLWNGHYPFIDIEAGGSIEGIIKGATLALSHTDSDTLIVPGHGPVATRADLASYVDVLQHVHAQVLALKGMSLTEIIQAKPSAKFDSKWGTYAVAPDDFVTLVYQSA